MKLHPLFAALSLVLVGLLNTSNTNAMETKPILTLDMAKQIAGACESFQQEKAFNRVYF